MLDKLYVMRDTAVEERDWDTADLAEERIEEVKMLLKKAPCVGALVEWEVLKRIREIKDERQFMRYCACIANGDSEREASMAFNI